MSAGLDKAVRIARNGLYGRELLSSHALTPEARTALSDHASALAGHLKPAAPQDIAQAISSLFLTLTPRSDEAAGARARIAAYVENLSPLPLWAITKAVDDFKKGRAGDGKWTPTAVEVYRQAGKYVAPVVDKLERAQEVLTAKVVKEVSPQRRADSARKVREQWGLGDVAQSIVAKSPETAGRGF